jgi:chromate reductase, NAD(P)H dehydrogenase (quinone)
MDCMRILAFAASFRAHSLNRKLIALAAGVARAKGAEVDLAEFREFDMPMYDGDVDAADGLPPGAIALRDRVLAADALIIATPEYNFSIAGPLKNAFDWVSRVRPMPWRGKSVYLMSASPSPMGGIRGLWQTRIPFEGCGGLVFPDMFALSRANEAFDDDGKLRDASTAERLDKELSGFVRLAEAVADICGDGAAARERRDKIAAALEEQTAIQSAAE